MQPTCSQLQLEQIQGFLVHGLGLCQLTAGFIENAQVAVIDGYASLAPQRFINSNAFLYMASACVSSPRI